jgi:hypothetical protein
MNVQVKNMDFLTKKEEFAAFCEKFLLFGATVGVETTEYPYFCAVTVTLRVPSVFTNTVLH